MNESRLLLQGDFFLLTKYYSNKGLLERVSQKHIIVSF